MNAAPASNSLELHSYYHADSIVGDTLLKDRNDASMQPWQISYSRAQHWRIMTKNGHEAFVKAVIKGLVMAINVGTACR